MKKVISTILLISVTIFLFSSCGAAKDVNGVKKKKSPMGWM